MKERIKRVIKIILGLAFVSPVQSRAACRFPLDRTINTWFGSFNCLDNFIKKIANWFTGFISAFCALMIVFAGFAYITSTGNPEQIQKAKRLLIAAISSLALVSLANVIIRTLIR